MIWIYSADVRSSGAYNWHSCCPGVWVVTLKSGESTTHPEQEQDGDVLEHEADVHVEGFSSSVRS